MNPTWFMRLSSDTFRYTTAAMAFTEASEKTCSSTRWTLTEMWLCSNEESESVQGPVVNLSKRSTLLLLQLKEARACQRCIGQFFQETLFFVWRLVPLVQVDQTNCSLWQAHLCVWRAFWCWQHGRWHHFWSCSLAFDCAKLEESQCPDQGPLSPWRTQRMEKLAWLQDSGIQFCGGVSLTVSMPLAAINSSPIPATEGRDLRPSSTLYVWTLLLPGQTHLLHAEQHVWGHRLLFDVRGDSNLITTRTHFWETFQDVWRLSQTTRIWLGLWGGYTPNVGRYQPSSSSANGGASSACFLSKVYCMKVTKCQSISAFLSREWQRELKRFRACCLLLGRHDLNVQKGRGATQLFPSSMNLSSSVCWKILLPKESSSVHGVGIQTNREHKLWALQVLHIVKPLTDHSELLFWNEMIQARHSRECEYGIHLLLWVCELCLNRLHRWWPNRDVH